MKALVVLEIELYCLSDPGAIHLQGLPYAPGFQCRFTAATDVTSVRQQ